MMKDTISDTIRYDTCTYMYMYMYILYILYTYTYIYIFSPPKNTKSSKIRSPLFSFSLGARLRRAGWMDGWMEGGSEMEGKQKTTIYMKLGQSGKTVNDDATLCYHFVPSDPPFLPPSLLVPDPSKSRKCETNRSPLGVLSFRTWLEREKLWPQTVPVKVKVKLLLKSEPEPGDTRHNIAIQAELIAQVAGSNPISVCAKFYLSTWLQCSP
ncbi:hypothetical protein QBC44DRAFT_95425 [Cladorrhinum sp. PSN332]|nr:hypothetical protein QBC44DRAFT_95425 [Cladorrhinum sp. PSN332]